MLHCTFINFHVEGLVFVVVVIGILPMHNHVFQLACSLHHAHRTKHRQRLPKGDCQKGTAKRTIARKRPGIVVHSSDLRGPRGRQGSGFATLPIRKMTASAVVVATLFRLSAHS